MSFTIYESKKYYGLKKDYSLGNHEVYKFGGWILVKFASVSGGEIKELNTAANKIAEYLIEEKSAEILSYLNWSKNELRKSTINDKEFELLEKYAEACLFSLKSKPDTYDLLVQKIKDRVYFRTYFTNEIVNGKLWIPLAEHYKTLREKSKKAYKYSEEVNVALLSGEEFLKYNKKTLKIIFSDKDPKIVEDSLINVKLLRKYTKKPGVLINTPEQLNTINEFFETLNLFRSEIVKFEKYENQKVTGFLETNVERKKREEEEKEQYIKFQEDLKNCKYKLRIEFKNLYPEKYKVWSNRLEELEKTNPISSKLTESKTVLNNLNAELSEACEIQDKPSREIKEFVKNTNEKVLIINGMAGTGKTTKVAEIINLCGELKQPLSEIFISAPSTVGAANIRQRWRLKTETFQKRVNKHTLYKSEYLKLFIVDEANMLTSEQLKMLFKKYINNKEIKFIFIGDSGQINAHDFDSDKTEESPALDKESIIESAKKVGFELTKYEIRSVHLSVDFRFLGIDNVDKFLTAMKWLRGEGSLSPIFENFLEKAGYPNSEVVDTLKSKDEIIDKFNSNLSIYDYLNKRLEIGQAIDTERLQKRFNLKFNLEDIGKAIKEYENPENRRPELGKEYSELFPSIKQRTRKPEEVDRSIILRRSNEGVLDSNTSLRPHLFNKSDSELNEIEVGELIFIKKIPKNKKEYQLKTNIDDGDLVVVTKLYDSIDHNGNKILHIGVKPVLKRLDSFSQNLIDKIDRFAKNFFNLGISFLSEIDISVWCGNLNREDDYTKWDEYNNSTIRLKPEDKKFHNPYLITYGYARTIFTAQGGEWENVFIHQGDMWGYSTKEQKKYLYTAVSRTSKKVYFSN